MPFRPANLVHTDEAALAESTPSEAWDGSIEPGESSSAEEHHVHTVGVGGSKPSSRTTPRTPPGHRGAKAKYVYFVQAEQLRLIKIGIAKCMASRLSGLQTGSPDKLILLGVIAPKTRTPYQLEQALHERFWEARLHGEWFTPCPRLLGYISQRAVGLDEIRQRELDAAMDRLRASQERLWAGRPMPEPDAPAIVEPPKGKSRKARMERYLLARGLKA